jgi:K+-transporting ATPase ATPase A chain
MEGKEVSWHRQLGLVGQRHHSRANGSSPDARFTPCGLVPMWLMQLRVIYGGVGSGLYGLLVFAIIAVFVAGLMVGRTPEYLGKKIEAYEMKMAAIVILVPPAVVLLATALAVSTTAGKGALYNADFPYTTIYNPGPHGFSEALYAYSHKAITMAALAGLGANNPFHNLLGGVTMLFARYWLAIPTLAIAGSLVRKKKVPPSAGTLPTHTPLFVGWIIAVVIIVGALSFCRPGPRADCGAALLAERHFNDRDRCPPPGGRPRWGAVNFGDHDKNKTQAQIKQDLYRRAIVDAL